MASCSWAHSRYFPEPSSVVWEAARGGDSLTGGGGSDRFLFGPGSGADTIADFQDQGPNQDLIDVTAYGFASVSDIGKRAAGNALILDFGDGNTVRLGGYLANHAIADINDDIVI